LTGAFDEAPTQPSKKDKGKGKANPADDMVIDEDDEKEEEPAETGDTVLLVSWSHFADNSNTQLRNRRKFFPSIKSGHRPRTARLMRCSLLVLPEPRARMQTSPVERERLQELHWSGSKTSQSQRQIVILPLSSLSGKKSSRLVITVSITPHDFERLLTMN
jgi:hypothetical protein